MFKFLFFFAATVALAYGSPAIFFDDSKIVGGVDAAEGQYPYQISIKFVSNNAHVCGGSIISTKTILTAGHCVDGRKPEDYYIFAGTVLLNGTGEHLEVEKLILHENYNDKNERNDIGLIILKKAIKYTKLIKNIEMEKSYIEAGTNVTLTGWGRLSYPRASTQPNNLQTIDLLAITNAECLKAVSGVAESEICTLTKKGEGSCFGDSGGPLVAKGKQVGIVSRGIPCAKGKPDVFTRVSSFVDWINKNKV